MTYSIFLGCLWVLASTIVALLPMRHQYIPGVSLLIAAPLLIVWIGYDHGWFWSFLCVAAFISMFRNPLLYFYRRARGDQPEIPK